MELGPFDLYSAFLSNLEFNAFNNRTSIVGVEFSDMICRNAGLYPKKIKVTFGNGKVKVYTVGKVNYGEIKPLFRKDYYYSNIDMDDE